ncbi:unnamed protein product [Orchesella dallaii]|uniref:Uncharacterized protein n=1 Tax=Orchesella dallaii TaxID=48710 RepID=A0ABP1RGJ4_9HEXA
MTHQRNLVLILFSLLFNPTSGKRLYNKLPTLLGPVSDCTFQQFRLQYENDNVLSSIRKAITDIPDIVTAIQTHSIFNKTVDSTSFFEHHVVIHRPQKFSHTCSIFAVQLIDAYADSINFLNTLSRHAVEIGFKWPSNIPLLILLVRKINSSQVYPKIEQYLRKSLGYRMVWISTKRNHIEIPCFASNRIKLVVKTSATKLEGVLDSWERLHQKFNWRGPKIIDHNIDTCENFHRIKVGIEFDENLVSSCTIKMILDYVKCVSPSCVSQFIGMISYGASIYTVRIGKQSMNAGFLSYGYKYSLLYHKNELESKADLSFLYHSFKLVEWVFVVLVVCLLIFVLRKTGVSTSTSWVLATIIDQGDIDRKHVNFKNYHLIIIWLLCTDLIRNMYTARMYDFLTAAPSPKSMPTSFRDLFHGNDSEIKELLADRSIINMLYDVERYRLQTNFHQGEEIENAIREKSIVPYKNYDPIIFVRNVSKVVETACAKFVVSHVWFCECPLAYDTETFGSKLKKFAIIYRTRAEAGDTQTNFYLRLLLPVFGNRQIYENNEQEQLVNFKLWFFKDKSWFFERFSKLFERLHESGIEKRLREYYDSFNLASKMRNVNNLGKFNKRISFITLAFERKTLLNSAGLQLQTSVTGTDFETVKAPLMLFLLICLVSALAFLLEVSICQQKNTM